MIAISFTNFVFLAYCTYLVFEQKKNVYKSKLFWASLFGFLVSAYIAFLVLNPSAATTLPTPALAP